MAGRQQPWGGRELNVHELLKREMYGPPGATSGACRDHVEISRACPQEVYGVRDVYVVLDSYVAADRQPRRGLFRFNFNVGNVTSRDLIGVREPISTLVQMDAEAFATGLPPLVAVQPTGSGLTFIANPGATDPRNTAAVDGLASQLAHLPIVTAYFPEIGLQAYSGFATRRHHFEFSAAAIGGDTTEPGARMALTPRQGTYVFTKPIQDVHGVTLQLYTPDAPLQLPPSVINGVQLYVTAALGLAVGGPLLESAGDGRVLNFAELLISGDRVFLDDVFVSAAVTNNDALNRYLSRPEGLFVGAVVSASGGVPSSTYFELDPSIDLTGYTINGVPVAGGDLLPQTVPSDRNPTRLRICKNRVRMPIRFRTIVPGLTNYIAP